MFRVLSDQEKNRLYLYLSGNIDKRESRTALDRTIKSLEGLTPGFDLVSNVSGYNPLSKSADIAISSLLKTVKEHGVRKTISIVEQPGAVSSFGVKYLIDDIGFYECVEADSVDTADELLETKQ